MRADRSGEVAAFLVGTGAPGPTTDTGTETPAPGLERIGVAVTATTIPTLLLVHGVAALLHVGEGIHRGAVAISCAVVGVALVHALVQWRGSRVAAGAWLVTPVAAALLVAGITGGVAGAISVAVCGFLQGLAQARVARALPAAVDGRSVTRPWSVVGWSLLAALAVLQTARLASHQADPEVAWWVTSKNPAWTGHQCVSLYVYAADLHGQGVANVYGEEHYEFGEPGFVPRTTVENLRPYLECGYEYPPPFLIAPWTLLRVTNDFHVIRPVWFALNGLAFLAAAVLLGLWVGGARGRVALWLLPAVWAAVPTLQTFQYGQFHLTAFALALVGMLAFEKGRHVLGGALLGVAVVTKIFPGVFLLLLAAQRRWRAVAATVVGVAAFGLLGLAILGAAPFEAFLTDKLPRILDGSAYIGPNEDDIFVAILTGITMLPGKLRILGVPFLPAWLGPALGHALLLGILAFVWRARRGTASPAHSLMLWLALLNLVVLWGPTAFVDYTTATHLWLLSFVSIEIVRRRTLALGTWFAWLLLATLLGTFPIPDDPTGEWPGVLDLRVVAGSTVLVTGIALALNLRCALPPIHGGARGAQADPAVAGRTLASP